MEGGGLRLRCTASRQDGEDEAVGKISRRAAESRSQNYSNVALLLKGPQLPQTSPMTLQLATPTVLLQAPSRTTPGSSSADAVKVR